LKDVRPTILQRNLDSQKYKNIHKPLIVSTLAATGVPKLKLLLTEDSIFLKTNVIIPAIREELFNSESRKNLNKQNSENRTGMNSSKILRNF